MFLVSTFKQISSQDVHNRACRIINCSHSLMKSKFICICSKERLQNMLKMHLPRPVHICWLPCLCKIVFLVSLRLQVEDCPKGSSFLCSHFCICWVVYFCSSFHCLFIWNLKRALANWFSNLLLWCLHFLP